MGVKPLAFHPEAVVEVDDAVVWYLEGSLRAAEAFVDEPEHGVLAVQEAPKRWPFFEGNFRRYLLRRFPFYIVYREKEESIDVVAVAHGRRRPGYWRARTT